MYHHQIQLCIAPKKKKRKNQKNEKKEKRKTLNKKHKLPAKKSASMPNKHSQLPH